MHARLSAVIAFALLVVPCTTQELADFLPKVPAEFRATTQGAIATRAAVLVGADSYRSLPTDALPTAKTTVSLLREALTAYGGFAPGAVATLADDKVHVSEVRAAIAAAAKKIQASDDGLLLVSWAGHGWSRVVAGATPPRYEQLLLTHFSRESNGTYTDCIGAEQLVAWLSEARAEAGARGVQIKPVLLIDACRVARGAPPGRVAAIPLAAWQVYGARDGKMVATGQGSEPFLFTGELLAKLKAFAGRGGSAGLDAVFAPSREATRERSKGLQDPDLVVPSDATLTRAGAPALVMPRRVSLTVRCVDALAGVPVANAILRINEDEVKASDGIGQRMLAPGRVVVTARAEGYLGRTDEVDLAGVDVGGEVTLKLVPYVAVVRGRLTPPATAAIVAAGAASPRKDFHRIEQTTGRDGAFELRVPALAGTELRVVLQGRVLQRFALPAQPSGFLRDRDGRHDGVPLVEIACELNDATLRALGADAPPVPSAGEPQLSDPDDRIDWEQAQQAMKSKRWDLARSRLRRIKGDPARVSALRRQVEARWAIGQLEQALAQGKASGEWTGVESLRTWWGTKPDVDESERIAGLFAEIEREAVPLSVRRGFAAGNKAYAEGELERALGEYEAALKDANAHYTKQIEEQRTDIRRRLYRRHASVAFQAELDGDLAKALDAYGKAFEHSDRVKEDLERLLADAELAQSARGRELARRVGAPVAWPAGVGKVPANWTCEVIDATPGAKSGYPKKVKDSKSGIVFLLVEPGEFKMGSTKGGDDEQPVHTVRITKAFYLAETETTQAQWEAVTGTNPSRFKGPRRPVEQVSWDDAWAFLRKLNGGGEGPFRLPTEAEWEYACRAGTTTEYAFGESITATQARFSSSETIDVGSLNKPNAWGFHDMHGNVWEWCQDWYDSGYYGTCRDGVEDPQGSGRGSSRVVRGGSWYYPPVNLRSACRSYDEPGGRSGALGFRAVRTL